MTEFFRNLRAQEPGIKVGVLGTMILREVGGAFIFPGERGLLRAGRWAVEDRRDEQQRANAKFTDLFSRVLWSCTG